MTALTKSDMKPSLQPCFLMKSSWTSLRSFMTADMSTSLKVVRMAAVCCAFTRWEAILRRSIDIFLRVVRPSVSALTGAAVLGAAGVGLGASVLATTGAGVGVAVAAGAGVASAGAVPAPTVILAISEPMLTSSPSGVMISIVPDSSASSSLETLSVSRVTRAAPLFTVSPLATCHAATFAEVTDSPAAGTMTSITEPLLVGAGVDAGAASALAGAGVVAGAAVSGAGVAGALEAAAAPSVILATTVPIATSSPSGVRICRVPSCSASSSVDTLSVSRVTRTSPFETASPSALCHWATFAEVTDSPAFGMITSNAMNLLGYKNSSL